MFKLFKKVIILSLFVNLNIKLAFGFEFLSLYCFSNLLFRFISSIFKLSLFSIGCYIVGAEIFEFIDGSSLFIFFY